MVTKHVQPSKILAMKEALGDHLYSKVQLLQPAYAERITAMLLECDDKEIFHLLTDSDSLKDRVNQALQAILGCQLVPEVLSKDKQELGELLFQKIAEMESQLCAQITGMLLELDSVFLRRLLNNPYDLRLAIEKAKYEFLKDLSNKTNRNNIRDVIGEKIYSIVHQKYSENADRITGMLLEMDLTKLQSIIDNPSELNQKIELAVQVLRTEIS